MKKLFFTAIALVAFSGISMAKTIYENSRQNPITNKMVNTSISKEEVLDCGGVWGSTRIYALNQGFTPDQASCIAMSAYIGCLGFDDAAQQIKQVTGTLC